MKRKGLIILLLFLPVLLLVFPDSITETKHNLSATGPGSIKSLETTDVCIFCHTSHKAVSSAPLWNREESIAVYTLYDSSTLHSAPDQPDGASKLCLSCHDGTIALGKVIYPTIEFIVENTSAGKIPTGRRSYLGQDLSDDHPISFDPTSAVNMLPELNHPSSQSMIKYDSAGKLQCTTCHDPHSNIFSFFLTQNNINGGLCKECHEPVGFDQISTHDLSMNIWNGNGEEPWPHS
ncbi:MAG: cytochrome c3 family protein, partial [Candidatus Aminicenantes bacterium]|nr:cytochrome c3 family protein [Candidatus Aminicenantes bacterium]